MYKRILIYFLWMCTLPCTAWAQESKVQTLPEGHFRTDSVRIGEVVDYTLTFRHAPDLEVFFPDSTHDFSPFEYVGSTYMPTVTDSLGSLDSIVYQLVTFEMEPVLELSVPVLALGTQDEADSLFPDMDGIYLKEVIEMMPDSAALLTDVTPAEVEKQFNYPYALVALGILLVLLGGGYWAFGKQIRQKLRLRRMQKRHQAFVLAYDELLGGSLEVAELEKALGTWKTYTGEVKKLPLQSFTSREIRELITDEQLGDSLKQIDRAVYGGIKDEQVRTSLQVLKDYTETAYEQKIQEVKNG